MSVEVGLLWLSFVDPARSAPVAELVPGGGGFLGVVIVEADGFIAAVDLSHRMGINPGGEVQGLGPFDDWRIGPEWRGRLLTSEEVDAMPCCTMHNRHCEPPGDLCCHGCTEAAHDTFPIRHGDGTTCVLDEEER